MARSNSGRMLYMSRDPLNVLRSFSSSAHIKLLILASEVMSDSILAKALAILALRMALHVSAAFIQLAPGGLKKSRWGRDRMICSMLFSLQR